MTIRKSERKPAELGSLDLYAELDELGESGMAINDAGRVDAVLARVRTGLDASLALPSRLHGWRTQTMFPAVVLAIGGVQLLTVEDSGSDFYFDDKDGPVKAPDFRLVTAHGEHLLVEVKNVGPAQTTNAQTMGKAEFEGAQRYAEWTGARLMVAHYWSGANLWTLVDPEVLTATGDKMLLTIEHALLANEFGLLGDQWIATTPPLVLSLLADTAQPRTIEGSPDERYWKFVIAGVEISCAGRRLETDLERKIAWSLMLYGSWNLKQKVQLGNDGVITQLDCELEPPEPDEASQGFAMIGPLSSLYSALYNLKTLDEAGDVKSLRSPPEPGVFVDLIPADYWDRPDRALPLWRFELKPSTSTQAEQAGPQATPP